MRIKDYFAQVVQIEDALKRCRARLQHYQDIGLSLPSPMGGSGGASGGHRSGSRVEAAAVGNADATAILTAQINAYMAKHQEAQRLIDQIPQEKYRQILTYRYLCGWSFRSISDEVGYSDPNSIYRAHGWALAEAQKVLDEMIPRS